MWQFQKKFPFSVPYVTIFLNNLLYLLSNRSELSLKHFWLVAMFLLHWVLVSCISPSISFLMLLFFPGFIYIYIYIYCPLKKIVKATLSRLLSSEFEESLTKPFIRWVVSRTYSGPWTTQPLTFTVVFVLWDSTENSPCKLNVFTNRYTVFVK